VAAARYAVGARNARAAAAVRGRLARLRRR
jgi:hypothetical protein